MLASRVAAQPWGWRTASAAVAPARSFAPARHTTTVVANAAARSAKPVLLLDVMDTIVYDPFFHEMPKHFEMSFKELLAAKHPTAWVEFECGHITEDELITKFFADGRKVDGQALKNMLVSQYRYLDGMEALLGRLHAAGYPLHALSNYPTWWRLIEDKLRPSRYLTWSFVSCEGPMKGLRKPAPEAYEACMAALQLPASELVFVDDRRVNVDAARAVGMDAILFEGAAALERELLARGLAF